MVWWELLISMGKLQKKSLKMPRHLSVNSMKKKKEYHIVTVKYAPDGVTIFRVVWIVAHRCLGFLHKPVSGLILRRNRDNINIASSTAETLKITNLRFAAFADEVYDRISLSGSGRFAAEFFYSAHTAFPPMNGIAPYRPCR